MMNDQTRFQMSIFADVSQVLLLSQFNYCIGCVRLSDLTMQVLSSLSLLINIFDCRHLQKFSRRQTGRRRRRKSASKTCHRRTVLSKSSTALRRHATVQRPWFWRMRSPDKWWPLPPLINVISVFCECGHSLTPVWLQTFRQVKDSWSKLRLVGKFSGFASGHTLLHENVVKITKVEVILMQEYLLMWHRQAHKQKRDQEKYPRYVPWLVLVVVYTCHAKFLDYRANKWILKFLLTASSSVWKIWHRLPSSSHGSTKARSQRICVTSASKLCRGWKIAILTR